MSDAHAAPAAAGGAPAGDGHGHAGGHHTNYVKVWAVLVGLLIVSVAGPMIGIPVLTLITAFGIAFVKAYIVATRFMHINVEKKIIPYMCGAMLALMALMVGAVSPDVMKHEGARWENRAAKESVERGMKLHPGHHGGAAEHHVEGASEHKGEAEHKTGEPEKTGMPEKAVEGEKH